VITPLQIALFDENGVRPFHRSSLGAGTALHAVGEPLDYARRPFTPAAVHPVVAFRLDDLCRVLQLPWPTRIKLDVDGFENRVLAGATEVLSRAVRDVYVELVEAEPGDPHCEQMTTFLAGLGYAKARVVEHGPPGAYPRVLDAVFTRS
jgi:FkbM family methyltransferase